VFNLCSESKVAGDSCEWIKTVKDSRRLGKPFGIIASDHRVICILHIVKWLSGSGSQAP
jgi:hypothetical protein